MQTIPDCICRIKVSEVCCHPDCTSSAFFCSSSTACQNSIYQQFHRHGGKQQIMPYKELRNYMTQIVDRISLQNQFDSLNKRIGILHASIDYLKEKYIQDLQSLQIKLKPNTKTIVEKFSHENEYKYLQGKHINLILKEEELYQINKEEEFLAKKLQESFESKLSKIEQILEKQVNKDSMFRFTKLHHEANDLIKNNYANLEEIVSKLQQAKETIPNDVGTLIQLAMCNCKLDQFSEAIKNYSACLNLQLKEEEKILVYNNLGVAYFNINDFGRSLECWNKLISFRENREYLFYKAKCLRKLKKYQKALEAVNESIELGATKQVLQFRAKLFRILGRNQEADRDEKQGELL